MDEGTFSDERLRTLLRRMDRGEITREEAAHVLAEHQVSVLRMRRIDAESTSPATTLDWSAWGCIKGMADTMGWPLIVAMGVCYAIEFTILGIMLGRTLMGQ